MIDALIGSFTIFDAIVFAVVTMSALMALSRGFMRELATLSALFFASIAAYFARLYFRDKVADLLPEDQTEYIADLIVIGLSFLIVYVIVRSLAGKFTSLIQGSDGVGMIDRLTGFVFGIFRGLALPFLFAWLILTTVPPEAVPEMVTASASYSYFETAARALNGTLPEIAAQAAPID